MSGVLYIVATPIGNLDDISLRAIQTLKQVELIAAEDTRHSKRLLNHLGIRKKLISLHAYNENERVDQLIQQLKDGIDIAVISDAGTPLISDPGYALVNAVQLSGIRVCPIPGACSVIAALCAAGLPTDTFTFFGFLSQKNKERVDRLTALKNHYGTLVLLESCHRIERLMEQLCELFSEHRIVVAKELTKAHERFLSGTPGEILAAFKAEPVLKKGEFVVVIDNPENTRETHVDPQEKQLLALLLDELPLKKAVQIATKITGKKKNELYQLALSITQPKDAELESIS